MSDRRSSLFFLRDKLHDSTLNNTTHSPDNSSLFNRTKDTQINVVLNLKQNPVKITPTSILNLTDNFENIESQKRKSMQLTLLDIEKISAQVRKNYLHQESNFDYQMPTVASGRQRKSFINPTENSSFHNPPDINTFRSSEKHSTKIKGINSTIPPKPKRIFKNNEDLFSHTLNFKTKKKNKITNDLLLQTQIRLLNRKPNKTTNNDLPIFNTTTKLNDYLIKQYHIGNNSQVKYSKKKQKIMEETFSNIRKKRKEALDQENRSYQLLNLENSYKYNTIENTDNYPSIDENYNETDSNMNKKIYYDYRKSEKMKKVGVFLNKLENLSNKKYEPLDSSTPINHNNLSRVIQLMKIKEKAKDDLNQQINLKKKKLKDDETMVILATSKLGPPVCAKLKLRNDTNVKYKGATDSFFGYPV